MEEKEQLAVDLQQAKARHDELYARAGALRRQLEQVRRDRERARGELRILVDRARREGMTWAEIAAALGVTPQRAAQMFD